MTYFDYKVVPAPRRAKKMKGVHAPEEHFAHTLGEAINEVTRQGWEYVRAETLPAETPRGWLRKARHEDVTVLVFRREREQLEPRLAAVPAEPAPEAREPLLGAPPRFSAAEPPVVDRLQTVFARREAPVRREPRILDHDEARPTPLRPPPRLEPGEPG